MIPSRFHDDNNKCSMIIMNAKEHTFYFFFKVIILHQNHARFKLYEGIRLRETKCLNFQAVIY